MIYAAGEAVLETKAAAPTPAVSAEAQIQLPTDSISSKLDSCLRGNDEIGGTRATP